MYFHNIDKRSSFTLNHLGVSKKTKNRLNRENRKKITEKTEPKKKPIKPIKILKKPAGSVLVL